MKIRSLTRAGPMRSTRRAVVAIDRQLPRVRAIGTEARPHGAKAQIAGEGDRTATANRGPVDQSDGRTFYAFETIDGGVEAALVRNAVFA